MERYYHSVELIKEKCIGCTDCIKRCPTEAIRVRQGKAQIINERCIDCGMCIEVCRSHAKKATTDALKSINKFKYKIAMPAPTLYGQFEKVSDVNIILTALKSLGFDDVFEVSAGAEIVTRKTKELIASGKLKTPVISSACPATIRLISMRFPSLLDNLLPIISPMEAAARLAKDRLIKKGMKEDEIGVFFISPCAAKSTYAKYPLGVEKSYVDGVLSINKVYMPLRNAMLYIEEAEPLSQSSAKGMDWALTGGESRNVEIENAIAVDGLENVIKILEQIEDGQLNDVDFIEVLACTGGCVGGPLAVVNAFVAKNFIRRAERTAEQMPECKKRIIDLHIDDVDFNFDKEIEQISVMKLDDNMAEALRKLERIEEIFSLLPMIDCGSCGAPTCHALAEDIVRGNANIEDCLFMLRKKVKDLAEMMFDISSKLPQTITEKAVRRKG